MNFALTPRGYFADFITMPAAGLALLCAELVTRGPSLAFALAAAAGFVLWTLFEYWLHRIVFHSDGALGRAHRVHHVRPAALIGVASGHTFALFAALYLAAVCVCGFRIGGGLALGFVAGYLAYISLHFAIHHRAIGPRSPLYAAKLRHLAHHRGADGNYGVLVPWWDRVFGTLR